MSSAGEAAAEDVEVSTTFLTFFKNGGGYIEYKLTGPAASELRSRIDDPQHVFPFETLVSDGDGSVDQSEGERYMRNVDDLLTRRMIILRGVKMDNVDVDDHRGLVGTDANSTEELYLHITFRGHIQYDELEFNVSGLEPLMVLFGEYSDIPRDITVDERTYIVAAGLGSYEKVGKDDGTLLNMRVPLAAVVSYHHSYTPSSVPSARMKYDHSTIVANPLALMLLVLIITYLALRLPKAVAKENGKDRVRELHLGILVFIALFWLFYVLGGAAVLVWVLGFSLVGGAYYMAHLIYVQGWRNMARDEEEPIDMGEALSAAQPVVGAPPATVRASESKAILAPGAATPQSLPPDEVVVEMDDGPVPQPAPPVHSVRAEPMAKTPAVATPPEDAGTVGTKRMKCKCGGYFEVPPQPRPLEMRCPHCGTRGTVR
jgi:hypothetical protein